MRNNGVSTAEQKYFDQSDKVIDVASQQDPATNANEILTGPDQVIGAAASVHYLTCGNLAVCNYTHCRSPTASISLLMKQKCKKGSQLHLPGVKLAITTNMKAGNKWSSVWDRPQLGYFQR